MKCGSAVAQLVPSVVTNDNFNRKLQREATGAELPDQWEDPMLIFAKGRWCRLSTALRLGKVVEVGTRKQITADNWKQ